MYVCACVSLCVCVQVHINICVEARGVLSALYFGTTQRLKSKAHQLRRWSFQ